MGVGSGGDEVGRGMRGVGVGGWFYTTLVGSRRFGGRGAGGRGGLLPLSL